MATEKKDLNVLAIKLKELFDKGLDDEQMAGKLNITVQAVGSLRTLLDLRRKWFTNVFNEFKKVAKDEYHNNMRINFTIPAEQQEAIGMNFKKNYKYMAYCSKGEIRLEINEDTDE
jgi:hypothetical protein